MKQSVSCSWYPYRLNEVSVKGMLWGFSFLSAWSFHHCFPSFCCSAQREVLYVTIYEPPKTHQNTQDVTFVQWKHSSLSLCFCRVHLNEVTSNGECLLREFCCLQIFLSEVDQHLGERFNEFVCPSLHLPHCVLTIFFMWVF